MNKKFPKILQSSKLDHHSKEHRLTQTCMNYKKKKQLLQKENQQPIKIISYIIFFQKKRKIHI